MRMQLHLRSVHTQSETTRMLARPRRHRLFGRLQVEPGRRGNNGYRMLGTADDVACAIPHHCPRQHTCMTGSSPWAGCGRTLAVAARAPPSARHRHSRPYCYHYSSRLRAVPASPNQPRHVRSSTASSASHCRLSHSHRLIVCSIVRSPHKHLRWWSGRGYDGICGRCCWRCLYGAARTPSATTRERVSMRGCSTGWTTSNRRRVLSRALLTSPPHASSPPNPSARSLLPLLPHPHASVESVYGVNADI